MMRHLAVASERPLTNVFPVRVAERMTTHSTKTQTPNALRNQRFHTARAYANATPTHPGAAAIAAVCRPSRNLGWQPPRRLAPAGVSTPGPRPTATHNGRKSPGRGHRAGGRSVRATRTARSLPCTKRPASPSPTKEPGEDSAEGLFKKPDCRQTRLSMRPRRPSAVEPSTTMRARCASQLLRARWD